MFPSAAAPSLAVLREWTTRLAASAPAGADGLERVRAMEELRAALSAAQAGVVAQLATERAAAIDVEIANVPRPGVGARRRREESQRQLVAEVATARRVSPWQAQRFVTWACAAPTDTPRTLALLAAGAVSERRAMTVLQVATPLDPEGRRRVDAALAADLPGWGDRKVDAEARAAVYRIDPAGTCDRAAYEAGQRRVSLRPAPECMAWLTALLPLPAAVSARVALEQAATAARGASDLRGRGQVMADTLVERITGQSAAADVPVAIQLVITDRTLLGGDDPARFADGTPYPAPLARDLTLGDLDRDAGSAAARSVRRLFTDPAGRLITAETRSRAFTPAMADLTRLRDGSCVTPWCDAPIRHIDHDEAHVHGGPTSLDNGNGRCQWCNQTKADHPPTTPEPLERSGPPPEAAEPPPPAAPRWARPTHRRRSGLERRVRRRITAAASRRPPIVVELRAHRCTLQR